MNSKLSVGIAILFLIAGGVVAFKKSRAEDTKTSASLNSSFTQTSRSQRQTAQTAESSHRFLKEIDTLDLANAPSFEEIQSRTAALTIPQIETLLEQNTSHQGLSGWLRSALWAELGRRNHRESFDDLVANALEKNPQGATHAEEQAIYAFLRGRIDILSDFDYSLDSVFADMKSIASASNTSNWQSRTFQTLFTKLTRLDPQRAWNLLQHDSYTEDISINLPTFYDSQNTSALKGFFKTLSSESEVWNYLKKWQPVMETSEAKKAYQNYRSQLTSRYSGFISIPSTESIVTHALASLARFDPDLAVTWLNDNEADPEKPDYNRPHGMWRALATNFPEEALEILSRPEFVDARRSSIGWLVQKDYSLAAEIISNTPKASHQIQILNDIVHTARSSHVNDFFPNPGGTNRLPNFQQRYDFLLEAVNLGTFQEKQKENLLKNLDRELGNKVSPE